MDKISDRTFKYIILSNTYKHLNDFEEVVVQAKEAGVTHVSVSYLADKSRWEMDDPKDPYLNWSMIHNSVFKAVVPELLSDWVPKSFAKKNLELIRQRCEIIKKHGLKASFLAYEPLWWPESIFMKHPQLRGPRVDQPRRSRHPRFSPDLFHDDILKMYGDAIETLVNAAPEIDIFIFSTNDSSTGLPWAEALYNTPNGPDRSYASIGLNIKKFLDVCEKSVSRSLNPNGKFYIRGSFYEHELDSIRQHARGKENEVKMAFFELKPFSEEAIQGLLTNPIYPVKDIGQPFSTMRNLIDAKEKGNYGIIINPYAEAFVTEWDKNSMDLKILEYFHKYAPKNEYEIYQTLAKLMDDLYGKAWGSRMLQVHSFLDRARAVCSPMEQGGPLMLMWLTAQRWITRPLVAFPERLTDEEREHFRPFQFQALTEEDANNPLITQGYQIGADLFQGRFLTSLLSGCQAFIQRAVKLLDAPDAPEEIVSLMHRLKCWSSLIRTASNFFQFYTLLPLVKERVNRDGSGNIIMPFEQNWRHRGDQERPILYNLMRSELDNSAELIELLSKTKAIPLILAEAVEEEDVFTLSPNIIEQLHKKMKLMMDHWLDLDELLCRPNL